MPRRAARVRSTICLMYTTTKYTKEAISRTPHLDLERVHLGRRRRDFRQFAAALQPDPICLALAEPRHPATDLCRARAETPGTSRRGVVDPVPGPSAPARTTRFDRTAAVYLFRVQYSAAAGNTVWQRVAWGAPSSVSAAARQTA